MSLMGLILTFGLVGVANAVITPVTPSTNDINRTNGWAHVDQLSQGVGTTDLQFISVRNFYSCFEYRTDGDIGQKTSDTNYNSGITDGLYPYVCVKGNTVTRTILANEYVEVRMVFGAETDERFDWTRFDVLAPVVPQSKDECKNKGWMNFSNPTFKNQGSCVSYVESNERAGKRD